MDTLSNSLSDAMDAPMAIAMSSEHTSGQNAHYGYPYGNSFAFIIDLKVCRIACLYGRIACLYSSPFRFFDKPPRNS